jgi:hypothetical protein
MNFWDQGAAGKFDFCHFFGALLQKTTKNQFRTFLHDFYRVRKIDGTFDLSSKHCFGFYGLHGYMYAYIIVKYVHHIILIVSLLGLPCRSSMDDIFPFSLTSENLENDAF